MEIKGSGQRSCEDKESRQGGDRIVGSQKSGDVQ